VGPENGLVCTWASATYGGGSTKKMGLSGTGDLGRAGSVNFDENNWPGPMEAGRAEKFRPNLSSVYTYFYFFDQYQLDK